MKARNISGRVRASIFTSERTGCIILIWKPGLGFECRKAQEVPVRINRQLPLTERRACAVLDVARSTLRYQAKPTDDNELRLAMIRLAKQYGWYGYRKVTALLRMEGWRVNHKRIERLWNEEGLQLPRRHNKRKRLYHKDCASIFWQRE